MEEIQIILVMKKESLTMEVHYDYRKWSHDVYSEGVFMGNTSLKEFAKDGWTCVERKILGV